MTQGEVPPEGSEKAPRVFFCTLGCRLNQHDTAAMRSRLAGAGLGESADARGADVVLVNTCTVTARADQEARQIIRALHRRSPDARIVVTGCYAQRAPEELRVLPGVTHVVGTLARDEGATLLDAVLGRAAVVPIFGGHARRQREFRTGAPLHFGRTRALLKVQDGCDAFCSYCVVPYVRGRSRSLPLAEAVERARRLLEADFREIVLTGADLGSYGRDLGEPGLLARLIDAILSLGSGHRVRISSIEPHKVDPAVVAMVGATPGLCRHLHLPLQSGSARVLRAMRRGYTPSEYRVLLDRVLARGPVGIGADVIVGFPGETEAEHEETYRFLEEAPVTFLHVFRYSERPGVGAARLGPAVETSAARERSMRLIELGEKKAAAFRRSLIGATLPVIPEARRGPTGPVGTSDVFVPVEFLRPPESAGIVATRILDVGMHGLVGMQAAGASG